MRAPRSSHAAERVVVVLDELLVAPFFLIAGPGWAALVLFVGALGLVVLGRNASPGPIGGLQLPWLFGTSVLAALFAPTTVGAPTAFGVWLTGFALWVIMRRGQSALAGRRAAVDAVGERILAQTYQPSSAGEIVWPVVVRYPRGRIWANRIAAVFLGTIALLSLPTIGSDLLAGRLSPWIIHEVITSVLLWIFLVRGSRTPTRILLDADRIQVARLFGRTVVVPWAGVAEVRVVTWTAISGRSDELVLVGSALAGPLATLDLGDMRQRVLVPLIRARLSSVPWNTETRTAIV